jgi:hypothetical protein
MVSDLAFACTDLIFAKLSAIVIMFEGPRVRVDEAHNGNRFWEQSINGRSTYP